VAFLIEGNLVWPFDLQAPQQSPRPCYIHSRHGTGMGSIGKYSHTLRTNLR